MDIKISTGDYKILKSGSVILFNEDSQMNMEIAATPTFIFNIILKFTSDSEKSQRLEKTTSENTIIYTCYNFNDLGTGTTEALSIATVANKEWYLHFWVYKLSDKGPRKVEYTIFESR